jgi:Mlc titration factor MtfA (ptsG expression regulator)
MFGLSRFARRRRALEEPFPLAWRQLLETTMAQWATFSDDERERLEELTARFVVDKRWQAANGFELTDRHRVLLAAMACVLILELDWDHYRQVNWIVVHPSTIVVNQPSWTGVGGVVSSSHAIDGQTEDGTGAIVLSWEAARLEAAHPEHGHNLVFHEFAHKLDLLDGHFDGTPPLVGGDLRRRWIEVCTAEHEAIRNGDDRGVLRSYAGVNPSEFFAVATEAFFTRPGAMREMHPDLYQVFTEFYLQDPASRLAPAR